MALGSTSIICFLPSRFDLESESTFDLEYFSSATSDFLEWHSSLLCQGILWYSIIFPCPSLNSHFPLVLRLGLSVLRVDFFSPSLFVWVGVTFACFSYEEFTNPNSCLFYLNLCLILIAYLYVVPNDAMSKNSIFV
jgi:hypothetical protein